MTLKDVVAPFQFVHPYQKIHLKKPATSDLMPVDFVTSTVQAPKYIIELNPIGNVKYGVQSHTCTVLVLCLILCL